jgi:MFS superfamily sulfate permease-like transporter
MKVSFSSVIKHDLPAALVVFLVAVPLCLGIALASGAPLVAGLISGVVGGVVVGLLSGSPLSVSGPANSVMTLVVLAVHQLGAFEIFLVSVCLAGLFQIGLGLAKVGSLVHYVPNTVIKGMMASIGLILIIKQFPHLVGYDMTLMVDEAAGQSVSHHPWERLWYVLGQCTPMAAAIGLSCLAWLLLADWLKYGKTQLARVLPAPLVAVGLGVALSQLWGGLAATHKVNIPPVLDAGFLMPQWSAWALPAVWSVALTIAAVASLETLLSIEAGDKLDPLKRVTPTNRELLAQGVGNVLSGCLGGLPVTSVVVRTGVNIQSGAQSKWSAILHGAILGLSVLFCATWLNEIPLASLAAILTVTGFKLTSPKVFQSVVRRGKAQWVPFVITVSAVLLTDLLKGIALGLLVALVFVAVTGFRSAISHTVDGNHHLIKLRRNVSFLNKGHLKTTLESIPPQSTLLIDLSSADFVDPDIQDVITEYRHHAHLKHVKLRIDNHPARPLDLPLSEGDASHG